MDSHLAPSPTRRHARMPGLPHDALGWWAFGLLLAAALNPLYCWGLWVVTHFDDPEATRRVAITLAVAVPAVVVGAAALARRTSRSVALVVVAALVGIEIAWAVVFVVAFEASGLGAAIAGGTALAVFVGYALGRRLRAE